MKLRYKILNTLAAVVIVAVAWLAWTISHNEDCGSPPEVSAGAESMKAATYQCYGGPDVVRVGPVEKPEPAANEVLVRVVNAAVNPLDYHSMRGKPYIMRLMGSGTGAPADERLGVDFAGVVEAVGNEVTRFAPGDRVFGGRSGAFGEFVVVPEDRAIAKIPDGVSFEQAAAVPVAGITAIQALRDHGKLEAGQNVLVNGASGGVGTYAVQIAKAEGARVSGVCSTRNVDMVKSIGADHVFDYKTESYLDSGEAFDLIIDNVGNHALLDNRDVMTDTGRLVIVGGDKGDWLGPLKRPIAAMLISPFVDQEFPLIMARLAQSDLEALADLMAEGKLKSVIDRRYSLDEIADAIIYSESGRARGKIIVEVGS